MGRLAKRAPRQSRACVRAWAVGCSSSLPANWDWRNATSSAWNGGLPFNFATRSLNQREWLWLSRDVCPLYLRPKGTMLPHSCKRILQ
jgi:hypothetical protein